MVLLSSGISGTDYTNRGFKLCDTFDKVIQFADSLLRCKSEVFPHITVATSASSPMVNLTDRQPAAA